MKLFSKTSMLARLRKSIIIASIWLPLNQWVGAETLSASRAPFNISIPNHSLSNFRGRPVKSYFPNDRVFFTLRDQPGPRLSMGVEIQIQEEPGGALSLVYGQYRSVAAAVGEDYLLTLWEDGSLWKTSLSANEDSEGKLSMNIKEAELISNNVASIASGKDHFLFIKTDGSLMGAGFNAGDGRFGYASSPSTITDPVLIAGNVTSVKAGHGFTLYLLDDNTLWGMGVNNQGQLGRSPSAALFTPTKIADNVKSLGAEIDSAWFIDNNNALYFMGRNNASPVGIAEGAKSAAIVPSGSGSYEDGIFVQMIESDTLLLGSINAVPETGARHWTSWGTQVRGIVSCNEGVIYVKKGTPIFRYSVPNSDDSQAPLDPPFDHIAPGSSFLTVSPVEDTAASAQLIRDYTSQRVVLSTEGGALPVIRFINKRTFNHMHTLILDEIEALRANSNWQQEGVAFYAYPTQVEGTVPVHRFFMPQSNSYYFAIGDNKKQYIQNNFSSNEYFYNGIAWYAYSFFGD